VFPFFYLLIPTRQGRLTRSRTNGASTDPDAATASRTSCARQISGATTDHDKHLPTMHGFDEFFGNLYHLNAEEEPETYYYPKDPAFKKTYGPRGVL
jgi:arylsulfatase A-like enzyme